MCVCGVGGCGYVWAVVVMVVCIGRSVGELMMFVSPHH